MADPATGVVAEVVGAAALAVAAMVSRPIARASVQILALCKRDGNCVLWAFEAVIVYPLIIDLQAQSTQAFPASRPHHPAQVRQVQCDLHGRR